MKLLSIAITATVALLAGCATAPAPNTAADELDLAHFRGVNFAPVRFTSDASRALTAETRALLEHDFDVAVQEALPPWLRAEQPSTGVMRVEVTVTELNASSPGVNLLTTALLFVPLDAGGVSFEARFYDGGSDEPFARTTTRHTSTPLELKGSFRRYGHATQALHDWASDLAVSFEEAAAHRGLTTSR